MLKRKDGSSNVPDLRCAEINRNVQYRPAQEPRISGSSLIKCIVLSIA
jgi:hypothetical protein